MTRDEFVTAYVTRALNRLPTVGAVDRLPTRIGAMTWHAKPKGLDGDIVLVIGLDELGRQPSAAAVLDLCDAKVETVADEIEHQLKLASGA